MFTVVVQGLGQLLSGHTWIPSAPCRACGFRHLPADSSVPVGEAYLPCASAPCPRHGGKQRVCLFVLLSYFPSLLSSDKEGLAPPSTAPQRTFPVGCFVVGSPGMVWACGLTLGAGDEGGEWGAREALLVP